MASCILCSGERLRLERHCSLSDFHFGLSSSWPGNADITQCTGGFERRCSLATSCSKDGSSPSSMRANSIRLKGPLPPRVPCRGGPPTLKKPLRLLPTFQTVTAPSSSETVSRRRPSGEKVTDDTGARCGSSTYSRDAVLSSYLSISESRCKTKAHMMTAPSCVPTASF
jgi:hypothetical protein